MSKNFKSSLLVILISFMLIGLVGTFLVTNVVKAAGETGFSTVAPMIKFPRPLNVAGQAVSWSGDITVTITLTDGNGKEYSTQVLISNGTTSGSYELEGIPAGTYILTATAVDSAQNSVTLKALIFSLESGGQLSVNINLLTTKIVDTLQLIADRQGKTIATLDNAVITGVEDAFAQDSTRTVEDVADQFAPVPTPTATEEVTPSPTASETPSPTPTTSVDPTPTPTASQPSGVEVPAPIAEWLFNSLGANNSIPANVGLLDLVVGSTGSSNNIFSIVSGINGNAVFFNQPEPTGTLSNYYMVKSSTAGQNIFNLRDAITIEMWVKFDRLASEQSNPITLVNRTSGGGYKLYLDNPTNTLKFQINSTSITGGTVLTTGSWYHIVGTYDKTAIKIYLNGVLDGQTALTDQIADVASANLKIGGESTGSATKNFKGCLDTTRFYNQALNAAQVNARYTGTDTTGEIPTPDPDVTPTATIAPTATPTATASATPTPTEMPYGGNVHNVTNSTTWNTAMNNLMSGDTIIITGTYTSGLTIKNKIAMPAHPVIIKAATPLGTTLHAFEINNSQNIVVQDFKFGPNSAGTLFKVVNSQHIQIMRNYFDHNGISTSQSTIVTTQASDDIEIGYNSFVDKNVGTVSGSYIKTQYDEPNVTKNLHIHHNYFKNIVPMPSGGSFDGDSDREAIVLGISDTQDIITDHLIEYNLFEDCDGENEIITVKTSRNIIRYNTFKNCLGSLSIRFGTQTEAYGNFFYGTGASATMTDPNFETGGIRAYGSYHKIYNNYFEGLTGAGYRIPLLLDGGDTTDSSGGDSHERPSYCEVTNNTIVDCAWGIGAGTHYNRTPVNNKIANNIVTGSQNKLFDFLLFDGTNTLEGNIAWPTGSATLGVTGRTQNEIWVTDPKLNPLTVNSYSLKKLASDSPAIDYAKGIYSYVTTDMDGESRATSDSGADEYSVAVMGSIYPLQPNNVGPNAL